MKSQESESLPNRQFHKTGATTKNAPPVQAIVHFAHFQDGTCKRPCLDVRHCPASYFVISFCTKFKGTLEISSHVDSRSVCSLGEQPSGSVLATSTPWFPWGSKITCIYIMSYICNTILGFDVSYLLTKLANANARQKYQSSSTSSKVL